MEYVKGYGTLTRKSQRPALRVSYATNEVMAAPYASACVWIRIWPFISVAALFDVENREKTGDDNKHHSIG